MRNAMAWPNLVLPVKRYRNHEMECGFMIEPASPSVVIYLHNMFAMSSFDCKTCEKITYLSPEEAVSEGWQVD